MLMVHFELVYVMGLMSMTKSFFFLIWKYSCPRTIFKNIIFSLLYCLCQRKVDYIYVGTFSWLFILFH
jgi:hypothetical protein